MPTTVYNAHNDSHLCTLWNLQQSNFKIILFSKGFAVKLQILDSHKFTIIHPLHLYLICNVMLRLQCDVEVATQR